VTSGAGSTQVDRLAADLRARILDADLPPGHRLREEALAAEYGSARHTVRAALRALAAQRLTVVEPHRGVRVAALDATALRELFELRTALEVEAARLLAERHGLDPWPSGVTAAAAALDTACAGPAPDRNAVDGAHAALHHALVAAAGSARITAAHAALEVEGRLALVQSRAALPVDRMAAGHRALLEQLREQGPEALRRHLHEGAVLAGGRATGGPGTGGPSTGGQGPA
jgi:DNA-binding GntR family transcriptional regulator